MADQEGVRIVPREPGDRSSCFGRTAGPRMAEELAKRLGQDTVVASSVNGEPGLWVGFNDRGDPYWLLMDRNRFSPPAARPG
jgi:two-component system osmolarity sensor histidine kinase EnvZ